MAHPEEVLELLEVDRRAGQRIAPPVLWGDEQTVRERLASYFRHIETELIPVDLDLPTNPAVALFRQYFDPRHVAFGHLDEAGQVSFASDLEYRWTSANATADSDKHTLIHNQYLQ